MENSIEMIYRNMVLFVLAAISGLVLLKKFLTSRICFTSHTHTFSNGLAAHRPNFIVSILQCRKESLWNSWFLLSDPGLIIDYMEGIPIFKHHNAIEL